MDAMDARETERVVRGLWRDFERDGIAGVLPWAAPDATWRPHSAPGRRFSSTADYAEHLARSTGGGEVVEAVLLGSWIHQDVGITRGRMRVRVREGGFREDTRMYWLFRVTDHKVTGVSSSPDLGGLLREAGYGDPALLQAAFLELHRGGPAGEGPARV
jgi:hypothetical protein